MKRWFYILILLGIIAYGTMDYSKSCYSISFYEIIFTFEGNEFNKFKETIKVHSKKRFKFEGPKNERQKKVVESFLHAWNGYKKFAWGKDELKPLSKSSSSWFNLGLTIIDSLDTMYIMGLESEFNEARDWVSTSLKLDSNTYNSLFEITIRILAGLLSAYHLSGDAMFLDKAYDLGNRSLCAFNTKSSIPLSDINLAKRTAQSSIHVLGLSEISTIQLEFKDLSRQTGDVRFKEIASKISKFIHNQAKPDGLAPIYIDKNIERFITHTISLGARGDSYYEYLLKQWIQNGARFDKHNESYLINDWLLAVKGIREKLVGRTRPRNITFIGELHMGSFSPKMDHLVCFLPGNLALGYHFLSKNTEYPKDDLKQLLILSEDLIETCYQMYAQMATGLSPEIVYFTIDDSSDKDILIKESDKHNLLRPETVESLFYLYKITKNKKYQEYGWQIFKSFEKYTKIDTGGYSSINDVTKPHNVRHRDKMESYFLAETLKYFYLLFEDKVNIDFEKWLF